MDTSAAWQHRKKLSWGAAAAAIGVVLLVFLAFSQWIEFTPGTSGYYDWASIDTFPYTPPIGGAAILLALAGWTTATSAGRSTYDRARLKRTSIFALGAVGIGFGGALWFVFSMWWEVYGEWWFDAGFYGLTFGGGTAAVLLWILARAAQPESPESSS